VAAVDIAELRRTAQERHFGPTLVMAESVAAGCCIVALAFFPVNDLSDAQPSLYKKKANGVAELTRQAQAMFVEAPHAGAVGRDAASHSNGIPVAQEVSHAL
jgi:hypothetical protein